MAPRRAGALTPSEINQQSARRINNIELRAPRSGSSDETNGVLFSQRASRREGRRRLVKHVHRLLIVTLLTMFGRVARGYRSLGGADAGRRPSGSDCPTPPDRLSSRRTSPGGGLHAARGLSETSGFIWIPPPPLIISPLLPPSIRRSHGVDLVFSPARLG